MLKFITVTSKCTNHPVDIPLDGVTSVAGLTVLLTVNAGADFKTIFDSIILRKILTQAPVSNNNLELLKDILRHSLTIEERREIVRCIPKKVAACCTSLLNEEDYLACNFTKEEYVKILQKYYSLTQGDSITIANTQKKVHQYLPKSGGFGGKIASNFLNLTELSV